MPCGLDLIMRWLRFLVMLIFESINVIELAKLVSSLQILVQKT